MPSGILMTHSELDCVQVRGTVGHVSAMIKCCSAAMLMSWTTRRLPTQTVKMHIVVFYLVILALLSVMDARRYFVDTMDNLHITKQKILPSFCSRH